MGKKLTSISSRITKVGGGYPTFQSVCNIGNGGIFLFLL
jgi:hypothetical protein